MISYLPIPIFLLFFSIGSKAQTIDTLQAHLCLEKAQLFEDSMQYDSAGWYYQRSADQFRERNFIHRYLLVINKAANLFLQQRNLDQATALIQEGITFGESQIKKPSTPELNELYLTMGNTFFNQRKAGEARQYYQEYLDRSLLLYGEDHTSVAEAHSRIGILDAITGQIDAALDRFNKVLAIRLKIHGPKAPSVSNIYNNIGNVYKLKGQLDKARELYEKALAIELEVFGEEHINLATRYSNLGLVCVNEGSFADGLVYFQKTLELEEKAYGEEHPEIPKTYDNIGLTYNYLERHDDALEYHTKALKVATQLYEEGHPYFGKHYNNIGMTYEKLGQAKEALLYLSKALDNRVENAVEKDIETANILMNIGWANESLGQPKEAAVAYQQALMIKAEIFGPHHAGIALAYNNLGVLAQKEKHYSEALSNFQKAIVANVPSFENEQEQHIPAIEVYALSNFQLIRSLKCKAMTIATAALETDQQKEKLDLALELYEQAIQRVNKIRNSYMTESTKLDLAEHSEMIYTQAFGLCWKAYQIHADTNYIHQAFFFAEQSKSMILLDAFKLSGNYQFAGIPDSLIQQEKNFKADLAFLHKKTQSTQSPSAQSGHRDELLKTTHQYRALIKKIEQNYPRYYQLKYETATTSIHDIQTQFLSKQSALLEYYETEEQFWLFVITPQQKWIYPIPKNAVLEESLKEWINHFQQKPDLQNSPDVYHAFERTFYNLYQNLLEPFLEKLDPSIQELVIVPHGQLTQLPFEALLTQKPEGLVYSKRNSNYIFSQLPYLNKKYAISYNNSATLALQMEQLRQINPHPPHVLAFAPFAGKSGQGQLEDIHRNESLSLLPGSMEEVKAISQYFKGYFYLKGAATENTFKKECTKQDFNLIHLSSHSISSQEDKDGGQIYFSSPKNEEEDNILFDHEIYKLSIPAQLIVLSACETGRGKYYQGEGLVSLARAFSYAGCPSLIMTLWRVNDQAGAVVMSEFYKELAKGQSKNISLQRAKQAYLKGQNSGSGGKLGAHPYYWASYVSLGSDWEFESR